MIVEVYKCSNCGFLYDVCRFDYEREQGHSKHTCCPICKACSEFRKIGNSTLKDEFGKPAIRKYNDEVVQFINENMKRFQRGFEYPPKGVPMVDDNKGGLEMTYVDVDGKRIYEKTCEKCHNSFVVDGQGSYLRKYCDDCKPTYKDKKTSICINCGKPVLRGSGYYKFCSGTCKEEHRLKKSDKNRSPRRNGRVISIPVPARPEVKKVETAPVNGNRKFYLITREGKKEVNLFEAMEVIQSDQTALYIQIGR